MSNLRVPTEKEWKKLRKQLLKEAGSSEKGAERLLDCGFGEHSEIRDENGNIVKEFS